VLEKSQTLIALTFYLTFLGVSGTIPDAGDNLTRRFEVGVVASLVANDSTLFVFDGGWRAHAVYRTLMPLAL